MDQVDKINAEAKAKAMVARVRAKNQLHCISCRSSNVDAKYQADLGVTIMCNNCGVVHTRGLL